jgi:hypothetical protein
MMEAAAESGKLRIFRVILALFYFRGGRGTFAITNWLYPDHAGLGSLSSRGHPSDGAVRNCGWHRPDDTAIALCGWGWACALCCLRVPREYQSCGQRYCVRWHRFELVVSRAKARVSTRVCLVGALGWGRHQLAVSGQAARLRIKNESQCTRSCQHHHK